MRRLSAYRVFLTRKSEYHVRGHMCFGVRDRRTGQWQNEHWALRERPATFSRRARKDVSLWSAGDRRAAVLHGSSTSRTTPRR